MVATKQMLSMDIEEDNEQDQSGGMNVAEDNEQDSDQEAKINKASGKTY